MHALAETQNMFRPSATPERNRKTDPAIRVGCKNSLLLPVAVPAVLPLFMGKKLDEAGKKIGETVSSPEFQQKAQDVGKQVGDFATRTADTVVKGVGSFFGAVGKAFETVQKDLKDIEEKQKTEKQSHPDKPADPDQKEGE